MDGAAKFIVRLIITAIAVGFAISLIPGIRIPTGDYGVIAIVAISAFLSIINVTIKPILQALSLPISIITLGIFALVVNTALLYLAVWCASTFFFLDIWIADFGSAFMASILISIITWVLSSVTELD